MDSDSEYDESSHLITVGASSPKLAQTGPAAATTEGGFYLDVCNVSYSVTRLLPDTAAVQRLTCRARKETVPILNNINLSVRPGELIALMGPSGAGKSSLLNILSGRVVPTSGEVCVNGRAQDPATMRHILNYIPQDDTLYESLTPRALLSYQAELQLPHLRTAEERCRHVESVLRMLDISKCADTVIGEEGNRGISGGQRKRVSIAMGFLSDPRLLFLDEPTSGLDSNTAEEVVQILRSLVEQTNRTIVCTIHQPSWHIFSLFDRLILLDSGSLIYDGAISQTQEAFNQAGFPTPTNSNPADHFMSVLIDQRRRGTPVVLASSDARPSADQFFGSKGRIQHSEDAQNELDAGYATSFFTQVWVLLRRSSWIFTKDPKQLRTRILLAVIVSTFLGICYLQLPLDQGSTTSRLSVLFTTVLFLGMNSLMLTVVLFPQERAVVLREYADGIYSAPAFFLAKIITVIFFQIINGLVFGTIIYWMAGMVPTATSFFLYTAVGMVIGSISVVLGVGIGTLLPSVDLASSIVVPTLMPLILFSGFLIPFPSIQDQWWIVWLYYISFFQYAFKIMAISQFAHLNFTSCGPTGNQTEEWIIGCIENFANCTPPLKEKAACPWGFGTQPGEAVLHSFGIRPDQLTVSFLILCALFVAVVLLSLSITVFRLKRR